MDRHDKRANATTAVSGSDKMLSPAPTDRITQSPATPEIAYRMVNDETYPQTQPRLNPATFVTSYTDEYATRLMNEAINIGYIGKTEHPRTAVMTDRCFNILADLQNTPEQGGRKRGAPAIGSSETCKLGAAAAWPTYAMLFRSLKSTNTPHPRALQWSGMRRYEEKSLPTLTCVKNNQQII